MRGIFFPVIVTSICALAFLQERVEGQLIWQQINLGPVCFHANGRRPGTLQYTGEDGKLMAAMKLVYRSGKVRCDSKVAFESHWGCYHHPDYVRHPLNVIVTDQSDNIIYPDEKFFKNGGLWYSLPFVDALHSDELVFTNYDNPFYISNRVTIKIWYGEDLRNWKAEDNGGKVCVDVYADLK